MSLTRRQWLASIPISAMVASPFKADLSAQAGESAIRVRSLNHFEIAVTDPRLTIDFYQGLFGMPVQARAGSTTILRVGAGPQFLAVKAVEGNAAPSITRYGLGVEQFNVNRLLNALAAHGVVKAGSVGPMQVTVIGGQGAGLAFGDPDGIVCELRDVSYCGGTGLLGNSCSGVEAPPKNGLMALRDVSHLTISSSDAQRSNAFFQRLFSFPIRASQGPASPALAVGPTVQFLMFAGGGGGRGNAPAPRRASINHACWSLDNFKPDDVLKTLENYGLKPRESAQGAAGPLRHYVTMRMENRGGAPGGTPELYFSDPDGLLMQLQDSSYCGGGGFLGNECPRV